MRHLRRNGVFAASSNGGHRHERMPSANPKSRSGLHLQDWPAMGCVAAEQQRRARPMAGLFGGLLLCAPANIGSALDLRMTDRVSRANRGAERLTSHLLPKRGQ